MAVWFMRRLQCLPCEQFTLRHAKIATRAGCVRTSQMIVKTTCCAREGVRMR